MKGGQKLTTESPFQVARQLFIQHGDEVYRYIRFTVGNSSDADDILQEVFLRVLESWHRFQHHSSPKTWIWSIANNCMREYFRKAKRTKENVPIENDMGNNVQTNQEILIELERSLYCLTMDQRLVFVERIIHEKSSKETSELLGWSDAKVRTTLNRAIKKIQAWFAKEEISK